MFVWDEEYEIFGSDSHSPAAVRWRQSVLRAGQYDCGAGYTSAQGQTIHACPFYGPCRALSADTDCLCELSDIDAEIDTSNKWED